MKKIITYLFVLILSIKINAQKISTVYGKITIDSIDSPIENVNIYLIGDKTGTTSDQNGYYSLKIEATSLTTIWYSHTSYVTKYKTIDLKPGDSINLDISLELKTKEINEVIVEFRKNNEINQTSLSPKIISKIPGSSLSGITSTLKTLPGVATTTELSTQYNVRGGNFDENLIYVNDIPIYKPQLVRSGQQEGLSFVNSDMISSLTFSSGGFDAKYGDKISSVLDIIYKKPKEFEASADLDLMGVVLHLGDANKKNTLTYNIGFRYRNTSLILNSLEESGDYQPIFLDLQTFLSWKISNKWSVDLLYYISNNSYKFSPIARETTFGTSTQAYNMTIYLDGQENDNYTTFLGALSASYNQSEKLKHTFIGSRYLSNENERYDIRSEYRLSEIESSGAETGDTANPIANGLYLEHARNELESTISYGIYNGKFSIEDFSLNWGIEYKNETLLSEQKQWKYSDSAGYIHPYSEDSIFFPKSIRNKINIDNNSFGAYIQGTKRINFTDRKILSLTGGLRFLYNEITDEHLLSPRLRIAYIPKKYGQLVYRFSTGIYYQPPFYKEFINPDGTFNTSVKSQKSEHYVLGVDYTFKIWNRPFKLLTELYYKNLSHIIPYTVDNVQIEYRPDLSAHGYASGLDMRLNGEFINGTESWISLSFLKTEEQLDGSDEWIRRPTDQFFKFGIFFQDFFPGFERLKVNISYYYGSSLPTGPSMSTDHLKSDDYSISSYQRVDLGASVVIFKRKENIIKKRKGLESVWLGFEVFNLLDIRNKISYLWIEDVSGSYYGIPNYLTSRRINLKLSIKI